MLQAINRSSSKVSGLDGISMHMLRPVTRTALSNFTQLINASITNDEIITPPDCREPVQSEQMRGYVGQEREATDHKTDTGP